MVYVGGYLRDSNYCDLHLYSDLRLAKHLFRMLLQAKKKPTALDIFGIGVNQSDDQTIACETTDSTTSSAILGRHYKRRSRFREPTVPTELQMCDGKLQGVYSYLVCTNIQVQ